MITATHFLIYGAEFCLISSIFFLIISILWFDVSVATHQSPFLRKPKPRFRTADLQSIHGT